MKKKKLELYKVWLLGTLLVLSFNCSKNDIVVIKDLSGKKYVHSLVTTKEHCDKLLEEGTNCAQEITFRANGKATIIVTDILHDGKYEVNGNRITFTSSILTPIIFESNADFTVFTRISDKSNDLWKLNDKNLNPWEL